MAFLAEMGVPHADQAGLPRRWAWRRPRSPTPTPGARKPESVTEAAPEFPPIDHGAYEIVRDLAALQPWIDAAHARGVVALDNRDHVA